MAIKFSLQGDKEMKAKLRAIAGDKGMRKEARGALNTVGGRKLAVMQERTPVKTGKLLRSERIKVMVSPKREDLRIALIAGGEAAPYARYVHEVHPTGKKFMETVLLEAVATIGREIAGEFDLAAAAGGAGSRQRDSKGRFTR